MDNQTYNSSEISASITRGLQEMLDHAQGEIELRSHQLSTTPPRNFTANEIRLAEHFELPKLLREGLEASECGDIRPAEEVFADLERRLGQ